MTVLGFDQSTTTSGWALFQDNEYRLSGVLKFKEEPEERLCLMADAICERIDYIKPDKVVIEDIFDNNNVHTLVVLARLQGAIIQYCHKQSIPIDILAPKTWRKLVGIKGKKRKEVKEEAVQLVADLYGINVSADEAESICITKAAAL